MTSLSVQNTGSTAPREQLELSLDEYKRNSRKDAYKIILMGSGLILPHIVLVVFEVISLSMIFRSMYFILGVVCFFGGIWELYRTRRLTVEDLVEKVTEYKQTREFGLTIEKTAWTYTKVVLACLIVDFVLQEIIGREESIQAAGLVKSAVRSGEIWRLLTCTTLHGSFLHILMNGSALIKLGKLIEILTNRAYLPIVFLVSAVSGSVFSLVLIPNTTSVGASGGLMGLVGFLAVLGYRHKEKLPPGFFKSVLISICFIGAIGLVGFAIIDNAAHLGGLLAGAICGSLLIKKSTSQNLADATGLVKGVGFASLLAIIIISLLSITMILR